MVRRLSCLVFVSLLSTTPVQAAIDLATCRVVGSDPAVLTWPITASLDSFGAEPGRIAIRTTGTSGWPAVAIDNTGVPVQSGTLWIFLTLNGQCYATGAERLRPNQLNGDKPNAHPSEGGLSTLIGDGWLYDGNRWGPMAGHNPVAGERIGVMVAAGSTRSDHNAPVKARTNVLEVVWPEPRGAVPMTVTWREGDGPPVPVPPPPAPAPSTPAPAPAVDLSGVQQEIVDLRAYVAALTLDQAAALGSFRQTLEQHRALLDDLGARVVELQARPVVRGCRASLSGIIPISCRVE